MRNRLDKASDAQRLDGTAVSPGACEPRCAKHKVALPCPQPDSGHPNTQRREPLPLLMPRSAGNQSRRTDETTQTLRAAMTIAVRLNITPHVHSRTIKMLRKVGRCRNGGTSSL